MKRTCPPPTNWRSIHAGDRVRFQGEGMPVEVEDTIQLRQNGMLITEGGREILPADYVVRVAAPEQALLQPTAGKPDQAAVDLLCGELQTIGQATAASLQSQAGGLADRIADRIGGLVLDLHEAKRWLHRPQD